MVQAVSNKMTRLTSEQLDTKLKFIENYIKSDNAAIGSTFDANSNVTSKNVATLMAELNKDINIQLKRYMTANKIKEMFGQELADKYIQQIESHLIYPCDESATLLPYCAAVSLSPYIEHGLQTLGGDSKAPQHLSSFNGGYINLIFALSSQFAGAIATVSYLTYFNFYAVKDYGPDYLIKHPDIVKQELQQVVYAINQPAASRGYQSAFVNWSIFDKYFFEELFKYITMPDGSKANWEQVYKLQKFFMRWFNEERKKALLTFPVITVTLLTKDGKVCDKEMYDFTAQELSKGNSFFIYMSDEVSALSSCCRLKSDIKDQLNDFQYSLGAGGIMTGSVQVLTLNVNRFVQLYPTTYATVLQVQLREMYKYQVAFREIIKNLIAKGMLPAYTAGYIALSKQYSTIGLNGILEAAEYLGFSPEKDMEAYISWVKNFFNIISTENKIASKEYGIKINTEQIPAESVGVKFANWDKADNLVVPRDCYNSYLYPVEDSNLTIIDKFQLHGKKTMQYMDGGSALHLNLEDYPTTESCKKLLNIAAQTGCPYFCTNVRVTCCNKCGYIDKRTLTQCSKCGSTNIDYATRVIGYLKRISNYSAKRQDEAMKRYYHLT